MTSCCLLFAVLRILLIRFLRGFGSRIVFLRIRIHNNVTFKNQASSLKSFLFFNVIFLASTDIFFLGKIHISLLLNQPPNDPDPHWSAIYQHPNDPDPYCSVMNQPPNDPDPHCSAMNQPPNDPDPHCSAMNQPPHDPDPHYSAVESASKWSGSTLICYWVSVQMIRIHIVLLLNQPPNDPDPHWSAIESANDPEPYCSAMNQPPNDPDPNWSAINQHPNDPDPHCSAMNQPQNDRDSHCFAIESASTWPGSTLFCYESASKWSGSTLSCYWISLQMIRIRSTDGWYCLLKKLYFKI